MESFDIGVGLFFAFLIPIFVILTSLAFFLKKTYIIILNDIFQYVHNLIEDDELDSDREWMDSEDEHKTAEVEVLNGAKEDTLDKKDSEMKTALKKSQPDDYLKELVCNLDGKSEEKIVSPESVIEVESWKWNLLARDYQSYDIPPWQISLIWLIGFLSRYCLLLPVRIITFLIGLLMLVVCSGVLGCMDNSPFKRSLNFYFSTVCFKVLASSFSTVVNYHYVHNRPKRGICFANYTSVIIDIMVLMCTNCYSLVGLQHGGILGGLQRALNRASPHVWFNRTEIKEREGVTTRLQEHISNPTNPPVLIFPKCCSVDNQDFIMFRKGSFKVGETIHPIAMKYNFRFGGALCDGQHLSILHYVFLMMTSWAIICDVWYLPPMYQGEDESVRDFTNRVKRVINHAHLTNIIGDGALETMTVNPFAQTHDSRYPQSFKL